MLRASQLLKFLWGEAVKHVIYLKNRTLTKALNGMTPYEVFYGKKLNLAGLHEFSDKVWIHTTTGSKLDGRSEIGQWVGFDEASNGHHIYWPKKCSVSIEQSVKFDTNADIFMPTSVPLEGEQVKVVPKQVPKPQAPKSPEPNQPTDLAPPVIWLTTFIDNPVIDHLGNNFEQVPLDQGCPRHICTESAAIRCLRAGEGVINNLPT